MQINLPKWAIDELDQLSDKSVKAYIRDLIIEHINSKTLKGSLVDNDIKESVSNGDKETTDQNCIH